MHQFHIFNCGLFAVVNPLRPDPKDFLNWHHCELRKQWHNVHIFVDMMLFTKENRILLKFYRQDKCYTKVKGKGFPFSILSVGPGTDTGVQAVSLQVTVSHPPGGRLPLLSARPAITSPATEHHCPLAGTKLYCLVTEAHRCKQLA